MASRLLEDFLRRVKLVLAPSVGERTDAQLLDCFVNQRDEAAFASLIRRHGPLVRGVARRILHHDQDAQDVCQATFLILARKAAARGWKKSIAGWLYRVAFRLAIRTRALEIRRRRLEGQVGVVAGTQAAMSEERSELYQVLDEELNRLGRHCREALVLCFLEGQTRDQASRQLGWSLRTLERRLQHGLKVLRARLSKRGVELPLALLTAGLSQQAADVSAATVVATTEAAVAMHFGAGPVVGVVSAKAVELAVGGLKAMSMTKIKIGALLLVGSLFIVGAGAAGYQLLAERPQQAQETQIKKQPREEKKPLGPPLEVWPEGTSVQGRVVDSRGVPVANAEVLLLGKERIIVDADQKTWFVPQEGKDPIEVPSTRTNEKGEFRIERKKGTADRLAVLAKDPLFWVVPRKTLAPGEHVEIKLPSSGNLMIICELPNKEAKQPVMIQSYEGVNREIDTLRFHSNSFSAKNPGETVFENLPPGQYAVERVLETPIGKRAVLQTLADRQLAKIESNKRATIRFDRKVGRPLTGQVKGLENIEIRQALVEIRYAGSGEQSAFAVIPVKSDGRFTTDPIPPGKYFLMIDVVAASTPEQSNQESDFIGQMLFTVPEAGDMPKVEVVAKPNTRPRLPNRDYRARVIDDAGKPVPRFEAMIITAGSGNSGWVDGRNGHVGFGSPLSFRDADAVDVLVRAEGYAPAVARFQGTERDKLTLGEGAITLKRGQKVELRFRLPEGLVWPKGVLPEAFFEDYEETVRITRQPENPRIYEKVGIVSDYNMLNVRETGAGRFEFWLAPDTPPFHVAIHAPGFLQHFEAGLFSLADAKEGAIAIEVPRPGSLAVRFDPLGANTGLVPFKSVALEVQWHIRGESYLMVATDVSTSATHELNLKDLAPGSYLVHVRTQPKPESKQVPGTEINPGAYFGRKELVLKANKSERIDFRQVPFDPHVLRGQRTAVLRIKTPDGKPAEGRPLTISCHDGHYGSLVVFTGKVPESGIVTLKGITDRVLYSSLQRPYKPYTVTVDDKLIGSFGFTNAEPTQEFEFHVAPGPGDMAPDVELLNVATGKPLRLSSLRGKVVCLEFWATWCGPCQPAMAKLNKFWGEQNDAWNDRVSVIPVSIDAERSLVHPHALRRGWDRLDHFWAGQGTDVGFDSPVMRDFVVFGVPEAILIGPDGRIVWRGHPLDKSGTDLMKRIEVELKK